MKILSIFVLCSLLCFFTALGQDAICVLSPMGSEPSLSFSGLITFSTQGANNRINMTVTISGVSDNVNVTHGILIHQWGDLRARYGNSSFGGAFDPNNATHGCPESNATNGRSRQLGDTGNWPVAGLNAIVTSTKLLNLIDLTSDNSLIGRTAVLHAYTDDCVNEYSSLSPIAQCVIGIRNPGAGNTNNAVNPSVATKAVCELQPTYASATLGRIYFSQTISNTSNSSSVTVVANVSGLVIHSAHAMYITTYGDIYDSQADNVGDVFNPYNETRGIPPYRRRRAGDLGNIFNYLDGYAVYNYTNNLLNLSGDNSIVGRAIIITELYDNCTANSTSGAVIAQCVIGIADPEREETWSSTISQTQNNQFARACAGFRGSRDDRVSGSSTVSISIFLALLLVTLWLTL